MPKYEHAVQVAEFSDKALRQLKKTFAPSLEAMFEARKTGGDSMAGGAAKIKKGGILRAMAGLAVTLANLVVWMGTLLTGVFIGFISEIKRLLSLTNLGKWFGKQWTGLKEAFKARWIKLFAAIKESKIVTSISGHWATFTAKMSATFAPLMEWIGIGDKGLAGGQQGPKRQTGLEALMAKFKKFFKKWPKTLAFGVVLGRFIPWLGGVLIAIDTIQGITKGWEEAKAEPDANFATKLWGAAKGGTLVLWDFFITQLFDMVGWIAKWLTTNALKLMGFDEQAGKIEKGPEWNIGTTATEGWKLLLEAMEILWDEIATSIWKGDESILGKMTTFVRDFTWEDFKKDFPSWPEIIEAIKPDWWKKLWGGDKKPLPPTGPGSVVVDDAEKFDTSQFDQPNLLDSGKKLAGKGVDAVKGFGADVGQTFTDTKNSLITGGISGAKTAKKKVDDLINNITSWSWGSGDDSESDEPGPLTMPESWKRRSSKIVSNLADSTFGSRIKEFVSKMWNEHGVDAQIYSGTRGKAEQDAAFQSGASKATHGKSLHNYGAAVDFFFGHKGAKSDWTGPWDLAGKVAEGLGLKWGGNFKSFKDRPHLQTNKTWKQAATAGLPLAMEKGGIVTKPQLAYIGEGLHPEAVIPLPNFRPGVSPHDMTSVMRGMGGSMGDLAGGGGAITTIVDASSSNSNATVLAVGNGPHPAPIDDGLHYR